MKEKYNFKIDSISQTVSIEVSSSIFPISVIMLATYHFIGDKKVIIYKGNDDKVIVTFVCQEKSGDAELEELAYDFNMQLITSFVIDEKERRNAGIREAMMKAALSDGKSFVADEKERRNAGIRETMMRAAPPDNKNRREGCCN